MAYNDQISRSNAQALIPEEVSNAILSEVVGGSVALSQFTNIQMGTSQTRMPVLSSLPTAYFVNGDTGLAQTTKMAWANKYLDAEPLAVIVPISKDVAADMSIDVWNSVKPSLIEALSRTIDGAVFLDINKPSSWPTAIVPGATAASHTLNRGANNAAAGGIAADISDAFALIEADGYDADFIIARTNYKGLLRDARDGNGVRLSEVSSTQAYGVNIEYPLRGLFGTTTGSAEFITGDKSQAIMGVRQDLTFEILDQAVIQDNTGAIVYNLAQQDMIALKVTMRVAYQIANTIRRDNENDATRYPFSLILIP